MSHLQITMSPSVMASENIRAIVERATEWLKDIVSHSISTITAEWDYLPDSHGRDLVTLRLHDFTDPEGITATFRPAELKDQFCSERRFYRLFGDFLQAQSHILLDRVLAASGSE